jgi:hypothetical protein
VISLKHTHRPLYQGLKLGQVVPAPVAAPAAAASGPGVMKPAAVLTGLALTGLAAATAYVGINYGMDKKNTDFQRALGWTIGVVSAIQGLGRLAGTAVLAFMPSDNLI